MWNLARHLHLALSLFWSLDFTGILACCEEIPGRWVKIPVGLNRWRNAISFGPDTTSTCWGYKGTGNRRFRLISGVSLVYEHVSRHS